jgi:hypothetical protein
MLEELWRQPGLDEAADHPAPQRARQRREDDGVIELQLRAVHLPTQDRYSCAGYGPCAGCKPIDAHE